MLQIATPYQNESHRVRGARWLFFGPEEKGGKESTMSSLTEQNKTRYHLCAIQSLRRHYKRCKKTLTIKCKAIANAAHLIGPISRSAYRTFSLVRTLGITLNSFTELSLAVFADFWYHRRPQAQSYL